LIDLVTFISLIFTKPARSCKIVLASPRIVDLPETIFKILLSNSKKLMGLR